MRIRQYTIPPVTYVLTVYVWNFTYLSNVLKDYVFVFCAIYVSINQGTPNCLEITVDGSIQRV